MMKPKLVFNVVDSVSAAYRFVWENRELCLYLAALPFLIRAGCFALAVLLNVENNLREGLIALPAYFAEGWMAGLLVRIGMHTIHLAKTNSPSNVRGRSFVHVVGPAEKNLINASMILYVLIQIVYTVLISAMKESLDDKNSAGVLNSATPISFLFSLVLLFVMIWAIRLAWLNVPVAMGHSMRQYLQAVHPFSASFYIIGITLLCTVPVGLVSMLALQGVKIAFTGLNGGEGIALVFYCLIQTFAQLSALMLSTLAMTIALYPILQQRS